ncbi:MAG: hypothetical protein MH825_06535 [Cyanobacteria bacterium]|nr:hypothetical protein [Cyanobacteriota bacterium]
MGFDGVWGRRTALLIWGRRSLPLLGSLLIHGLVLASLSAWGGRSPEATQWQVETVELTPEELVRVPDLEPSVEPPLSSPGGVGGWQGLPVPSEETPPQSGSRAADRWQLPSSSDGGLAEERSGRALYDRWLRQQERDRLQERAEQRRLQAQRDRIRAQERRRQEQEQARRRQEQGDQGDRADGSGGTEDQKNTRGQGTQGQAEDQKTGSSGSQTQGTNPGGDQNQGDRTDGPREVAGPLAQLPPVASNPPAAGDRGQFTFDGRQVGTDTAGVTLGNLLASDAPWGQLYGEQPMRDGDGKVPEAMQGAWLLVNDGKPLDSPYRTPVALCSLSPAPEVVRLAVLIGPDGQRATGTPPEAFQPQVVTSSGYRALDDYAIAQLDAALTAQQEEGKKRLTPFNGYGVFVYAIRYAKSAEVCGPQGNGEGGGDRGDGPNP